jgi:hypothetical protein
MLRRVARISFVFVGESIVRGANASGEAAP